MNQGYVSTLSKLPFLVLSGGVGEGVCSVCVSVCVCLCVADGEQVVNGKKDCFLHKKQTVKNVPLH